MKGTAIPRILLGTLLIALFIVIVGPAIISILINLS